MAYQLKEIRYNKQPCHILLQNENGPCPLLAAANCLLLKGTIRLPSNCMGAGFVSIDQLVNVLAEKILSNQTSGGDSDHHVQEALTIFPTLQFGMDVNPKFIAGPTGVEYTMQLNAFDLLHIELVHGWLLEPEAQEYELIGNQTYNQLINMVIEGNDAASALAEQEKQEDTLATNPLSPETRDDLSTKATTGSIVKHFLDISGHQLTQYGLTVLHEYLKDGQMMVFFRNNHFNTLTKYDGLLYLLVTDLGYADVSTVVWEKLDVIDGDTEYVTQEFSAPPSMRQQLGAAAVPPEQSATDNRQSQADYQLALQLSQEQGARPPAVAAADTVSPDEEMEAARQASLHEYQRANPGAPLPTIAARTVASTTGSAISGALEQGMTSITDAMRQASTSARETAATMIPPSVAAASIPVPTAQPSTTSAVPLPTAPPSTLFIPTGSNSASTSRATAAASIPATHPLPSRPGIAVAAAVNGSETVAVGVPAAAPSQEDQDLILAMQLQRHEESERSRLVQQQQVATGTEDAQSRQLVRDMQRQDRAFQQRHVSRPGAPPARIATVPRTARAGGARGGKDGNCVIS